MVAYFCLSPSPPNPPAFAFLKNFEKSGWAPPLGGVLGAGLEPPPLPLLFGAASLTSLASLGVDDLGAGGSCLGAEAGLSLKNFSNPFGGLFHLIRDKRPCRASETARGDV